MGSRGSRWWRGWGSRCRWWEWSRYPVVKVESFSQWWREVGGCCHPGDSSLWHSSHVTFRCGWQWVCVSMGIWWFGSGCGGGESRVKTGRLDGSWVKWGKGEHCHFFPLFFFMIFFIFYFRHSRYNIIWGLRFKPEVWVCPLPEPEPAKRFMFRDSAEPDSWTSGSESGLDWIQKVWEPDHGQSKHNQLCIVFIATSKWEIFLIPLV